VKIKDYDAWIKRDWLKQDLGTQPIVLIYGADAGLVHERSAAVVKLAANNPDDPFQLVRLDGDEIASDPLKLVDEANTIAMFGGRRVIWVRLGSKQIQAAVQPLLNVPPKDAIIILEAGDLKGTSPVRTLCEKSPSAAVIACYADEGVALAQLINSVLGEANLSIRTSARTLLIASLGGDRAASRGEVDKLAMYCKGKGQVDEADIEAIISDVASLDQNTVIDGAFAGDFNPIETDGARLFVEGTDAGVLLNAAMRHAFALKKLIGGRSISGDALKFAAQSQGIYFKRLRSVEQQLRLWNIEKLEKTIAQLADAVLSVRRNARIGDAIATRALWTIALGAKRK
jgi:DNA polymerase III subunit delta